MQIKKTIIFLLVSFILALPVIAQEILQAAQNVAGMGVEAVITGNVWPNAFQTLSASGIKIVTGASGIVRDAVERFGKGELEETTSPTVGGHFGMGGGRGGGRGMGGGRGR